MAQDYFDAMADKWASKKYANIPEHARPKPKRAPETSNGIAKNILLYCKYKKLFCRRISSEGRFRPGETVTDAIGRKQTLPGKWLPGLLVGMPDIMIIKGGQFIGLEIKVGKDKLSAIQKATGGDIIQAGGKFIVVKTFDDFLNLDL